jgi:dolichol-phosphate mannosyltransferase
MDISVIIPVLNEEGSLEASVKAVCRSMEKAADRYEVIIVDDGSSDNTAAVAGALARGNSLVRVVSNAENLGYGKALRDGFSAAKYDYVFFTDADGQFDLEEFRDFPLAAKENAIVCGYRKHKKYGLLRRFTSFCYNMLARAVIGPGVRDVNCAFKLIKRDVLEGMGLTSSGFFVNAELLAKARRAGVGVAELPVSHFCRTAGASKVRASHVLGTLCEMTAFLLKKGRND